MKDKLLWYAIEVLWILLIRAFGAVATPALREGESAERGFIRLMTKAIEAERKKT